LLRTPLPESVCELEAGSRQTRMNSESGATAGEISRTKWIEERQRGISPVKAKAVPKNGPWFKLKGLAF
jgi:hypothetical protein